MSKLASLAKYQLPIFFLLTFLITWIAQITAYNFAFVNGHELTNEANVHHFLDLLNGNIDSGFLPYYLLFIFSFGPSLAGLIVTAMFKGKKGLKGLYIQLTNFRIPMKWYLFAILIPLGLNLASLGLGYVLSGFQPIEFNFLVPLSLALPFLLYMIIFTGLQEEIGWRGYALPELQKKFSAEKSSWILGVAWGLWHLPANLAVPFLNGTLTVPFVITILLALTLGIVGWTIVLTWFYNNTKSLFLIIFIHGFMNILQSYLILSSNNQLAPILYGVLPWVVATYLLKKYGGKTLLQIS